MEGRGALISRLRSSQPDTHKWLKDRKFEMDGLNLRLYQLETAKDYSDDILNDYYLGKAAKKSAEQCIEIQDWLANHVRGIVGALHHTRAEVNFIISGKGLRRRCYMRYEVGDPTMFGEKKESFYRYSSHRRMLDKR